MNSLSLLVFAIVALAVLQTSSPVKADGAQTRPTDVQPSPPVNGLRGYLQIYGRKTYDSYHPGEPFECGGVVQDVAGRPIEIAVGRNCYSSLYVRVPDGRVFIEPAQFRGQKDPPRSGIEQLAPKNSVVVYLLRGHLNDHLQGWIDGRTFQPDTDVSFREPGKYTFWFEYEVPNGNPAVWSGKLESNRITLTVTDLPPAQRLQKPTPAQLDDLKTFLASSRSIRPRPAAAEMADAMRQTENEGLAIYLVGQLDQSPEQADELLYLLAQRVIGIDGPYLKSLANWCIEILEHGNPPKSFQSYGGLIGDVTQYLHFSSYGYEDARADDRRGDAVCKRF